MLAESAEAPFKSRVRFVSVLILNVVVILLIDGVIGEMCELAVKYDESEHLKPAGSVNISSSERSTGPSLSQLCVLALHKEGPSPRPVPTHGGWLSNIAHTPRVKVIGMRCISRKGAAVKGIVRRNKQNTWPEFEAEIVSALATPGTKLRSSKQFTAMEEDPETAKVTIANGDVKIEFMNNDISLGDPLPKGTSHIKCVRRGTVKFDYVDTVTSQTESRDTSSRVATIAYEIQRELEVSANNRKFQMDNTMGQLTTSSIASGDSQTGLNIGFVEDRATDNRQDLEIPRIISSSSLTAGSPMDTGTPVNKST